MKKRDIYVKYPDKTKADALIDRLHKAGLWHYDPDFDKDKEEGTVSQLFILDSLLESINYGNPLAFFIPEIKMRNNPMTFRFYPHWFSRRFTTMLAMVTRSCRMTQRPRPHPSQPKPKVTNSWARCCWMIFSQQELCLKRQQAPLKAKKLWPRHLMVKWLQRRKRKRPKKLQSKMLNQRLKRSTIPSISSIKKMRWPSNVLLPWNFSNVSGQPL